MVNENKERRQPQEKYLRLFLFHRGRLSHGRRSKTKTILRNFLTKILYQDTIRKTSAEC